jgi:hypothetical protein
VSRGRWGRFTAHGSVEIEQQAAQLAAEIAQAAATSLPRGTLSALVLLGGYGRGEGGVEMRGGREHLHNNFDLLLIGNPLGTQRFEAELGRLARQHGVGIDLGATTAAALRRSRCLVMWYDMRFGHKTLLGDAALVPSLRHLTADRIVPSDVEALLTNRATLLVLNEAMLARGPLDEAARRTSIKHLAKAIVGYGDACLFTAGRYHHSYLEKARRVQLDASLPERFKQLHAWASGFRLGPDYARAPQPDLGALTAELLALAPSLHLALAAHVTSTPGLGWEAYAERLLAYHLAEGLPAPRAVARKLRNCARAGTSSPTLSARAAWGLRCGGTSALLGLALPALLYPAHPRRAALRDLAAELLAARSTAQPELRRAYLSLWSTKADLNGAAALERLGLRTDVASSPDPRPASHALQGHDSREHVA